MVQRVVTQLVDDLDGKDIAEGGQTIAFSIGRTDYTIDLSQRNADRFHKALQPYTDAARRIGRRPESAEEHRQIDSKTVRAWAGSKGIAVSPRGRVPANVVQQYRDALN